MFVLIPVIIVVIIGEGREPGCGSLTDGPRLQREGLDKGKSKDNQSKHSGNAHQPVAALCALKGLSDVAVADLIQRFVKLFVLHKKIPSLYK